MAKTTFLNNPLAKFIRGVASCMVGLPVATVATCVLGTCYAVTSFAQHASSHFVKQHLGARSELWDDKTLAAFADFFKGSIGKTWSGFGIYGFKTLAQKAGETVAEQQSELGFGDSSDSDDTENYTALRGRAAQTKNTEKIIMRAGLEHYRNVLCLNDEEMEEFEGWLDRMPKDASSKDDLQGWLSELGSGDKKENEAVRKMFAADPEIVRDIAKISKSLGGEEVDTQKKLEKMMADLQSETKKTIAELRARPSNAAHHPSGQLFPPGATRHR